jgi:hypothetical protein
MDLEEQILKDFFIKLAIHQRAANAAMLDRMHHNDENVVSV